jgi:hypothetical protein
VVSSVAYSTPAHSLTFSTFVAMSQGHSVSSLSQLQSTLAAKRKGDSHPQKGNAAKKRRGKSDTHDGTKSNAAEKRRGKIDTEDDAKYNDNEDVLPVTDAPLGEKQWEEGWLAAFNTATVVAAHQLKFMQRAFPPKPANDGKKKIQGATGASITACRPQSEVDYIMFVLMHWQVGVKLTDMNSGTERDRLQKFHKQHCNGTKITGKYCLERIHVPGEEPHVVLRRHELGQDGKHFAGQIVVSREQVFDAIDEWH